MYVARFSKMFVFCLQWCQGPVHSLDWCNTPAPGQAHRGRSAYRLAIASFLENYQNQIAIIGLQDERVLLEDEYSAYPDFTMLCEAHHGYPVTSLQWQPAAAITSQWSNKSPAVELLATTGDALRIWEYSSEGSPASSGYVGRGSQSASHSLHMKTALSGASHQVLPYSFTITDPSISSSPRLRHRTTEHHSQTFPGTRRIPISSSHLPSIPPAQCGT